jgi:DNA modification methylase
MRTVFAELRRTLRDDGTLWLNLGDCYNAAGRQGHGTRTGYKQGTNRASATGQDSYRATAPTLAGKNLIGIPWRVALALQADGWYLRSDIIWNKPNPMPESVTDRPTRSHEYMFLLSKSSSYYYDADAIREPHTAIPQRRLTPRSEHPKGDSGRQAHTSPAYPQSLQNEPGVNGNPLGRNKRDVWDIAPEPYPEAHFAVFPPALVQPCILAGSRTEDLVFDPFAGSGTTLAVARSLGRRAIGSELNPKYIALAERRLSAVTPALPLAQPRNLTSKAEQESDQLVMRTLDD